jgi:hypothetical protein
MKEREVTVVFGEITEKQESKSRNQKRLRKTQNKIPRRLCGLKSDEKSDKYQKFQQNFIDDIQ